MRITHKTPIANCIRKYLRTYMCTIVLSGGQKFHTGLIEMAVGIEGRCREVLDITVIFVRITSCEPGSEIETWHFDLPFLVRLVIQFTHYKSLIVFRGMNHSWIGSRPVAYM